jgi:rhodanese-related sulfurtransferase
MSGPGDVPQIDPDDAARRIAVGALLLDVRELNEWRAGHAPGAHHVPMADVPATPLPEAPEVVVICRAGGRSQKVAEFLAQQGVVALNLAGGMRAWAATGLDVVTDEGATGTVI